MTDKDQREWPSFSDVLAALDGLAASRRDTASVPTTVDSATEAPLDTDPVIPSETPETDTRSETPETDTSIDATPVASSVEPHADGASDVEREVHAVMPDELAPVEFDTTVLDFVPNDPAADFDTSTLDALDPVDSIESVRSVVAEDRPTELGAFDALEPDTIASDSIAAEPTGPSEDTTSWLDAEPDALGWADEPEQVADIPIAGPSSSEAFAPDEFTPEVDQAIGEQIVAREEVAEDPVVEEAVIQDPVVEDATVEHGAMIFELDPTSIERSEAEQEAGQSEIDWPVSDDAPIAEVIEPNFDSVATADAIESELNDLFALDQIEDGSDASVVPLHPSSDDLPEALVGLDDAFDPDAGHDPLQQWVGVGEDEPEDPWAYMRPDDAAVGKSGFWASRPKFFGGDERKRRKAARKSTESTAESTPGPTCPNCAAEGRVDLDDPVGGKIHASCEACDHVWSEAYDPEQRSA